MPRTSPPASADLAALALALSRALQGAGAAETAPALERITDWSSLAPLLSRHGLTALAYSLLGKLFGGRPEFAPAPLWESWHEVYRASAIRQFLAEQHLEELIRTLELPPDRLMVLKGFWLARRYYPDPATRPMTDTDLLVRLEDLPLLLDTLRDLGYESWTLLPPAREVSYWRWRAGHLTRADPGPWVRREQWQTADFDLHTHLWPLERMFSWTPPRPDPWEGAGLLPVGDLQVSTPSPELGFYHLCLHNYCGGLREGRRLLADFDLLMLLRGLPGEWSWEHILHQARRYQILPALHYALVYAQENLDAPLPPWFLDATRPSGLTRALLRLVQRLWLPKGHHLALVQLCLVQSPRERLKLSSVGVWHGLPVLVRSLAEKAHLLPGGERMDLGELYPRSRS